MSCGNPHDVDCGEVLERVWLYLDGEIDAPDLQEIRQHLDECGPCLRAYGLEQAVKALVARSCGCEQAPIDLRTRVVTQLRQVSVDQASGDRVSIEVIQVEYRAD